VPQPPNVDGLPIWLQIAVSLIFVGTTALMAMLGYRKALEREPSGAATTVLASIPDMSSVRNLTDVCRILCGEVEKLDSTMRDHTHYLRDKIEVDREVAMRLRELREEIVRSDRQRAERG
jgi:hypothetical protein